MIRRLVSVATVLATIVCVVIGYVQAVASQEIYPLGANASFHLKVEPRDRLAFLDGLREVGMADDVAIWLVVPDRDNFLHSRVFYSLGARQPVKSVPVPMIDPSVSARLEPASQIGEARLSGYYVVQGSSAGLQSVQSWLRSSALDVNWTRLTPFRLMLSQLAMGGLVVSFLAVLVLGCMTSMAWYSSKAEGRAIRLIVGESHGSIHARDLLHLVALLGVGASVSLAVAAVAFVAMSGWENAVLVGMFAIPGVATWMLVVVLTSLLLSLATSPKPEQIAGRVPQVVRFETMSQLLKVGSLAIALAVLPALALTAAASAAKADAQSRISPLRDQLSITISGGETAADDARVGEGLTKVVGELDKAGQVVFEGVLGQDDPRILAAGFDGVLLINTRYLDLFQLRVADLRAVPESTSQALVEVLPGVLRDSKKSAAANGFRAYDGRGQPWIGAIAGGGRGGFVVLHRPLVLVTANVTASVNSGAIHSLITTENITFDRAETLLASVNRHSLADVVSGVQRVTDTELQYAQFLYRSAATMALAAVVLAASVLLGVGISARIFAIRNARRIFVHRSAGAAWSAILRRRMMLEGVLVTVVVAAATGGFMAVTGEWTWWPLVGAVIYAAMSAALHVRSAESVFARVASRSQ